jgi:lipoprotein-releasing system permease protein
LTAEAPAAAAPPGAFSRFEFLVAGRYLRARRKDAFISVIGSLTLVGIAIGVATLIVVMSVMNGFRDELLGKILGLNGHFTVYPIERQFTDYDDVAVQIEQVEGVEHAVAFVDGQALATGLSNESTGCRCAASMPRTSPSSRCSTRVSLSAAGTSGTRAAASRSGPGSPRSSA